MSCRHSPDRVCNLCEPPLDPRITEHIKCDCVPELGPPHCHLCSMINSTETPWTDCTETESPDE